MKFRIVRDSKSIQMCLLPDVKIADFDSMKHYKIHRVLLPGLRMGWAGLKKTSPWDFSFFIGPAHRGLGRELAARPKP